MRTPPGFGFSGFPAPSLTSVARAALLPTNWTSSIFPRVLAHPGAVKMTIGGRVCQLLRKPIQRQAARGQALSRAATVFAEDSEQEVLGANMFLAKPLRFFRSQVQDAFRLRGEWHLHGSREPLTTRDLGFDFLSEGLRSALPVKEFPRERE